MIGSDRDLLSIGGLALAAVILGLGIVQPFAIDPDIQMVMAIFIATVILWMAKPVPYAISSLLCVMLLFGLGVVETFSAAVSGFTSTVVYFFILLLLIGLSISTVDLDTWVANRIVSTNSTPRSSVVRMGSAILMIAFIMPSALARTVTFLPVVDQINDLYGLDDQSSFRRLGYYLVGHLNPMASLAVMTGGVTPILTAELITALVRPITWVEWALYMVVPVILIFSGAAIIAGYFFSVSDTATIDSTPSTDGVIANNAETVIDPLSRDQWIVIILLGLAINGWVVGSFVGIPAVIPAMVVVFVLALPGIDIIDASDFTEINWGIIFLLGAMLSLIDAMAAVDAFSFITDFALSGLDVQELGWVMLLVLLGFTLAVRATFSSPAPAIAILLPIILEFTNVIGFDGLFVALSLMLILNIAVFLPFQGPPVLLAYERGPLSLTEVFALGVLTVLCTLAIVVISWLVYWPFIDTVVTHYF